MGRRRERRGCSVTVLFLLLLLLLAGGALGWFVGRRYMPSSELADKSKVFGIKSGQVALILDNELQEDKGFYEDGQVYIPVEWVNKHLNERFYWDANEKLLVYALPESIMYADADAKGENGPLFKVTSQGCYLSLGLVVNYTDIRTQAFATSQIKRVFIDTIWEPYDTAVIKKASMVREKGGVRSPILTELAPSDSVDILETMDRWTRVRTQDGYIGYLENRRLAHHEQVMPESLFQPPVYKSISMDEKVRLGFHQVTSQEANNTLGSFAATAKGMNVIVPTWFNVTDSEGTYTSYASKEYVDKAHSLGLKVWAMVENVSTEESVKNLNTKTLMSYTSKRKKLIEKLMKEADAYGFDGFNLDFESLKAEAGPHYVQFIREMSVSCRKKGLVLSIDNYVPSPYTQFYNRKEQGIVADYVIIMAYDEHYAGGDAGTVSSVSYVKDGIENTLKEVPKEKAICAVPFFTRVWTVKGDKTTSKAYGISDAEKWMEANQVERKWDDSLGQYYGQIKNADGEQYIWLEDERSLSLKIDQIIEHDLAGVGCWKLGFETPAIWNVVSAVK